MKFWFIVCAILSFLIVFKILFICFVVYYIIHHLIVIYADIGTVRRWSHGGVNHIQPLVVNGTVLFQSTRMRSTFKVDTQWTRKNFTWHGLFVYYWYVLFINWIFQICFFRNQICAPFLPSTSSFQPYSRQGVLPPSQMKCFRPPLPLWASL